MVNQIKIKWNDDKNSLPTTHYPKKKKTKNSMIWIKDHFNISFPNLLTSLIPSCNYQCWKILFLWWYYLCSQCARSLGEVWEVSQARPGLQTEARSLGTRGACCKTCPLARFEDGGCRHMGSAVTDTYQVKKKCQFWLKTPQQKFVEVGYISRLIPRGHWVHFCLRLAGWPRGPGSKQRRIIEVCSWARFFTPQWFSPLKSVNGYLNIQGNLTNYHGWPYCRCSHPSKKDFKKKLGKKAQSRWQECQGVWGSQPQG